MKIPGITSGSVQTTWGGWIGIALLAIKLLMGGGEVTISSTEGLVITDMNGQHVELMEALGNIEGLSAVPVNGGTGRNDGGWTNILVPAAFAAFAYTFWASRAEKVSSEDAGAKHTGAG